MFNKFNEETKKIIALSKKEMIELKHPYLGSEHIMLGILKKQNSISILLKKYGITYKKYKDTLVNYIGMGKEETKWILYTPVVKEIFERAIDLCEENGSQVTIDHLFISLIELGDCIANRVFEILKLDMDKIYTELIFKIPKKNKKKKSLIDDIGIEFTSKVIVSDFDPVIGREDEIKQIIEILIRKNKCNPLLVGDAGVGKTAIVEEISRLIVENKVPNKLKNKRIINIDMSSLVAGTKYRGEFEEKINRIIKEVESNDEIILFIDEIHTIVGAGGAEGAIDASNIFKPALARGNIKCIGATTLEEYKRFIEKDKALERRFKKVLIEEPNIEQTKNILYKLKPLYENYHHVNIDNNLLDLIVELTNKYIHSHKNPDKTIDILDEVCAHANIKDNSKLKEYNKLSLELDKIIENKKSMLKRDNFKKALELKQKENTILSKLNELELLLSTTNYNNVSKKDIYDILKNKINIPIIDNKEKIVSDIRKIVIGQDTQILQLVNDYFTYNDTNNCLSIMLNGNIGTGKTLLANTFAHIISNNVITIQMSEYNDYHTISKLLGAPPGYVGYEDNNYIFDSVRQYPFSVIILDEIEKAHNSVINLLNQILDTGKIKDNKGNDIYFNNTIFIMITNIEIDKSIGFKNEIGDDNLNNYFDSSFINKINDIINLDDLNRNNIINIIKKHCKCKIDDNKIINDILSKSNYKEYGASRIKKLVEKYINCKKIKKICKNYSKN